MEDEAKQESGSKVFVFCLAYFSTLKMETVCSSETSRFLQTTRNYNQEGITLCNHPVRTLNPSITTHFVARHEDFEKRQSSLMSPQIKK
jgi:hypothetical protein